MADRALGYYWVFVDVAPYEPIWAPARWTGSIWKLLVAHPNTNKKEATDDELTSIGSYIQPPDQSALQERLFSWIFNRDTSSWQVGLLGPSNWVVTDDTPDLNSDGFLDWGLVSIGPQLAHGD